MKRIVILGAGTADTITANKLAQELDLSEWKITIVDQSELHYYQPGFLFIPLWYLWLQRCRALVETICRAMWG